MSAWIILKSNSLFLLQTDERIGIENGESVKKNSLNDIDDENDDDSSDTTDDDMDTTQKLEAYSKLKDSSADPDYVPMSEPSSEELSSDEIDTEEEKTESQRKLNREFYEFTNILIN